MKQGLVTTIKKILFTNATLLLLVFVFLALGATVLLPSSYVVTVPTESKPVSEQQTTLSAPTAIPHQAMDRAEPSRLHIPAIGVDTGFEKALGLNYDATVEVPDSYDAVGWYRFGPTPGELGPAVILGHVDSYEGPAVFYRLGQLKPGDAIRVERTDGSVANFEVTSLERHEQSGFPTEMVYGDIDHAGLRLITCSGVYVRGEQRYTHNLIVFARLVEER